METKKGKDNFYVIELGGVQHFLSVGQSIKVNNVSHRVGEKFSVDKVYLIKDGEKVEIGTPTLNVSAQFEVIKNYLGVKVKVRKYKAKSRYRRNKGHRQELSEVKLLSIGKKTEKQVASKTAKPTTKTVKPVKAAKVLKPAAKTTAKRTPAKK
jgi:large subunit ribosomal protein L21